MKTQIHQIFIESESTHSCAFIALPEWPIFHFQIRSAMKTPIHLLSLILIFYVSPIFAQNVGINIDTPIFDLDVRGTDDTNDGGELQLATPSQTNFLRFFGGRLGDRHPFIAFHDMDTFHVVTTLPDWSTYTRRMTLLPSGNLGIGITEPQSRLSILGGQWNVSNTEGDFSIGNLSYRLAAGVAIDGGGAGISRIYAKGGQAKLILGSDNTDVIAIDSANRVGIGVTTPGNRLDVKSNGIVGSGTIVLGLISDISDRPILQFSEWEAALPNSGMAIEYDGTGGNALNILGTDALRKFTFTTTGHLGIATQNPGELLEIAGNGRMFIGDGGGINKKGLLIDAIEPGNYVRLNPYDYSTASNMDLYLPGKVGAGISLPLSQLHVHGTENDGTNSAFRVTNTVGLFTHVLQMDGDEIDAASGTLSLQKNSINNLSLVDGGGRVGIGLNSSPTSKLTILGLDNDGITATQEIRTADAKMLLDADEIDVFGNAGALRLNYNSGKPVVINTYYPATGYALCVGGKVIAEEMRVQLEGVWPDYVFDDHYKLTDLHQLDEYVRLHKHLPGIPDAQHVAQDGILLGEMQARLLEKIEELTLHVIALNKRLTAVESENLLLKSTQDK